VLVPNTAVGALGVPVNAGDSRGAFKPRAELNPVLTIDPPTNKLALKDESKATERPAFKETSPALTTTPVKDGAARGAFKPRAELNPVLTIEPPTNKLALKDESKATERPAFNETSPAEITDPVKDGDARGAFKLRELVNPVLTIEPFTNRLPLNEASALDTKKVPVKDGDALGAFNPIEFVIVVENAESLPNAVSNSFNVSNAAGALATSALISERTY
jgi:hypothetical protein